MKKILVLTLLCAVCTAAIGAAHYWLVPLYEWTRALLLAPIILSGIHYRRAGSTATAIVLYTVQTPFYYFQFLHDVGWGVNYCVANMFICGLGIFLGHAIRLELENAATLNQVQENVEAMDGGAEDFALMQTLEHMVRERGESDLVETFLYDDEGLLAPIGEDGDPLPETHLFYAVAESGQPFVSRFTHGDRRLAADPASAAAAPTHLAAFPLAWGGRTRGVIALADSRNENFGRESAAFITTIIQSVENRLELIEKRRTTIAHDLARQRIRDMFSSYVSRSVAEEILKDPDRVDLGGKLLDVTVMFTEVRNFEALLHDMEPATLFDMLNQYFSAAIDTVFEHEGTLDKFIEDGVMAFWGAPLPMEDAPDRAVRCALALHARINVLNAGWADRGLPQFSVCIGINTGSVVAGNIGSIRRMEYTVIGDTVNVAARIKSLSGKSRLPLLISGSTCSRLRGAYPLGESLQAAVKGKSGPITVHTIEIP